MPHKLIKITDHTHNLGDGAKELVQMKLTKLVDHYPELIADHHLIHVVISKEHGNYLFSADINIKHSTISAHKEAPIVDEKHHEVDESFNRGLRELVKALDQQLEKHKGSKERH